MAFADVSDLESRWRELSTEEEARANVLLGDASAMLDALVDVDESDAQQADLLKVVCCNMVMRSMASLRASRLTFPVTLRSLPLAALSPCSSRTWLLCASSVRLRSVSRARPSSTSSLAMCRLLNHGEANRT